MGRPYLNEEWDLFAVLLFVARIESNKQQTPKKSNYSQEESLFLADTYEEFKLVIDAKHKGINTNRKKKRHGIQC